MLSTISGRSTILLAALLVLVAPAQADSSEEASDEAEDTPTEPAEEDTQQCQLVDYSLSKPTSITPDPDRCFIPYILGHIPV